MGAGQFWRGATARDLADILAMADQLHPSFPEDPAVFAERLQLYPAGMRLLELNGRACGYLVSHPWRAREVPPLNTLLHRLPTEADTFYLHDLALLPAARGGGAARAIVEDMAAHARSQGFATMSLVAVNGSIAFWQRMGFAIAIEPTLAAKLASYEPAARLMMRDLGASGP